MIRSTSGNLGASVLALLSCAAIHGASAQIVVPSFVNFDPGTGLYNYSYSVTNNGPAFDVAILNVPVAHNSNLLSLLAPAGFGISYDPRVDIVSFFEDADLGTTETFSPGSTNGLFRFSSTFAPGAVTFDALNAGGDTYTSSTLAPVTPVPEPGTVLLAGLGVLATASRRRSVSTSK